MPDHVHLVLTPLCSGNGFYCIPEITQGIKSSSAHQINHLLGRKGQVWQRESLDHVLRREESIPDKVQYIRENPVRVGLVERASEYQWSWIAPELVTKLA